MSYINDPARFNTVKLTWKRLNDTSKSALTYDERVTVANFIDDAYLMKGMPNDILKELSKVIFPPFTKLEKGLLKEALARTEIHKLGVIADKYELRYEDRGVESTMNVQMIENEFAEVFQSVKNLIVFNGVIDVITPHCGNSIKKRLIIEDSIITKKFFIDA